MTNTSSGRFINVSLHLQADSMRMPVVNNRLSVKTVQSQFPGSVGLKWRSGRPDECWIAVEVDGDDFVIPEDNDIFVVVSGSIDRGRQILNNSQNLALNVANAFKGTDMQRHATLPVKEVRVPYLNVKSLKKASRTKKVSQWSKSCKVVFIKSAPLPTNFGSHLILLEGVLSFDYHDEENTIMEKLRSIVRSGGFNGELEPIQILTYVSKRLSIPCLSEGSNWNALQLKTVIGQGKLYVMLSGYKDPSSLSPSSSTETCSWNEKSTEDVGEDTDEHDVDFPQMNMMNPTQRSSECEPVATSSLSTVVTSLDTKPSTSNVIVNLLSSSNSTNSESDLQDFALVQHKRKMPLRRAALRFRKTLHSTNSQQQSGQISGLNVESNPIEVIDSEDEDLQQVLEESLSACIEGTPAKVGDIHAILKMYQGKINKFDKQEIIVFRKKVLDSAFRALKRPSFDVQCKLYVKFSGELGLDHGGPRREFFRLVLHELFTNSSLFTGKQDNRMFAHNLNALHESQYRMAGKLVAMSLAQEGPAIGCLNKEVFMLMAGLDPQLQDFDLALIPDDDTRQILEELSNVNSMASRDAFLCKNGEWVIDQGIQNAWRLKIPDISMTLHALVKQAIFHRTASEIDQFCKGLNDVCGLMVEIKKDPTSWQTLFCDMGTPMTKELFLAECNINLSCEGSNRRIGEEETIYSFEIFLQDIQEKTALLTFGELLAFATGADKIPPCGFGSKIQILFYDQEERTERLPFVSTCALNLNLPRNSSPEKLKELLLRAVKGSLGFEKC